jgi:predicted ATPase/class 3 adenylate cyclase
MRCPRCQFENLSGMRFCGRCGASLGQVCPSCGTLNPEGFTFCGTCGTRLTPQPVPSRPSEERKVVTILFADLAGSTALGERLDPEQVRTIVGRFFEQMASVITLYGGTVEKFVGDEVMAIFGLPSTHEDDPARAVHAAQAMQTKLQELNSELQRTHQLALNMRIGVNTGEVVADPQAAEKGEFMVTGDAVNVAARLRSAATPGTAVVGDRTYRETTWLADYSACPPLALKGKAEPVVGWQLIGLRPEPVRRPTVGLRAPMIGRQDEFGLLQGLLQRVLRERRPHLVTVLGMPGVGKSRLVEELLESASGVSVRQGRSLAYGSTSLWAIGEIIRADCGILRSDSVPVMTHKLQQRLDELLAEKPAREQIGGQLASILAIQVQEGTASTEESRENLFWSVRRFVEAIAVRTPLILVFDDIHWADAELLDLIEYLAQWTGGVPLLIVGMARPELLELRPAWGGGKRNSTSLFLEPLTGIDTDTLLKELLHIHEPLPAVISAVGVAEGNPFFVEEILRMMIDAGALRREDGSWTMAGDARMSVPDTVQGVVTARIDRLQREEKATLLEASVLGKDFWAGALAFLTGQPPGSLDSILQTLLVKDFLVERERSRLEGQREFTFTHLIIRDAAYQILPKARRAEQHRAFATWLEQTLQDRVEGFAELLAHHWLQAARLAKEVGRFAQWAEVAPKALQYALAAARKAARVYANEQAITHFQTARDLADSLQDDANRVVAVEGLADVYALQAQWEEASRLYQEALTYHLDKGDEVRQARVQSRIGSTFSGVFDFRQALPHIQSAIQKLEGQQAEAELASVYIQMARTQAYIGNFRDAEQYARSGVQLADQLQLLPLAGEAHSVLALIGFLQTGGPPDAFTRSIEIAEQLNDLSRAISFHNGKAASHAYRGEYREALAATERALALARESNNRPRLALSLYKLGEFQVLTGNWKMAETTLQQYLAMSEAGGTWAENARGLLAFVHGDLDPAIAAMEKAIAISERQRNLSNLGVVADWAGFLQLRQRRFEPAGRMLAEFIDRFTGLGMFWPAYLHPLAAEAAVAVGDLQAATEHCRQAASYGHLDLKPAQARLHKAVGLLRAAGRSWSESITSLRSASDIYADIGQPYDQALCLEALAQTYLGQDGSGATESASKLLSEAITIYLRLGAAFEVRRLQESAILK